MELNKWSTVELKDKLKESEKHYSDEGFWEKLKKYGKKAGSSVVYTVLLLYFTLQKPEVPKKTKLFVMGALGYFILPFDLVPDFVVGVGYLDDLGALGAALVQIAMYIDNDVKVKARSKLTDWFDSDVDTSDVDARIE